MTSILNRLNKLGPNPTPDEAVRLLQKSMWVSFQEAMLMDDQTRCLVKIRRQTTPTWWKARGEGVTNNRAKAAVWTVGELRNYPNAHSHRPLVWIL